MTKIIYQIPSPNSINETIEIYGNPENAWYEWRIIESGKCLKDSKARGYGQPEIALRDALMYVTGLGDPNQ